MRLLLPFFLLWIACADHNTTAPKPTAQKLLLLELLKAELEQPRIDLGSMIKTPFAPLLPDGGEGILNIQAPEESYGYWAQSTFDFVGVYGADVAELLAQAQAAQGYVQARIDAPEVTHHAYTTDAVVGDVRGADGYESPIARGHGVFAFDFGSGRAMLDRGSYLEFDEAKSGAHWKIGELQGSVGAAGFVVEQFASQGGVWVGGGSVQGSFAGEEARHLGGDFMLSAQDKSASGQFFATR